MTAVRRVPPGPGQEWVRDYPRPPRLERPTRPGVVRLGGGVIAKTQAAWRVLETSHSPGWYGHRLAVGRDHRY